MHIKGDGMVANDKMFFRYLIVTTCLLMMSNSCASAQHTRQEINGWQVSQETYNRQLIESLKSKIAQNIYKQINSIIVIKNGRLLIEEYFNGAVRDQLHDTRSVGKTFSSAILGIALKEGYIKSLDQTLSEFYDLKKYKNYSDKKRRVTLRNLLTMSAGFDGNDSDKNSPGNEEHMYPQANWVDW